MKFIPLVFWFLNLTTVGQPKNQTANEVINVAVNSSHPKFELIRTLLLGADSINGTIITKTVTTITTVNNTSSVSIANVTASRNKSPVSGILTALHLAAKHNDLDSFKLLIQQGDDINSRSGDGSTALHVAAAVGHFQIVRFIVDVENANLSAQNYKMETPLMLAERAGHTKIAKLLKEKVDDISTESLITAVQEGRLDDVKSMVMRGADVNSVNDDGDTPLMLAASTGRIDVVQFLVEKGRARVEAKDDNGFTPVMWAAFYGELEVVQYLVEKGRARVEARLLGYLRDGNPVYQYLKSNVNTR